MKFICLFVVLLASSGIFGEDDLDIVLDSDIFKAVLKKAFEDEISNHKKPSNDLTETDIDQIYNHTEVMNEHFAKKDSANKGLTETDINEQNDYQGEEMILPYDSKRGVETRTTLWPRRNGVLQIPYTISSAYNNNERNIILRGIRDVNRELSSCNRNSASVWVPRNSRDANHRNFVRIIKDSGCYSYVGMINQGGQPLSLARGCLGAIGIVHHEMMHAMGFMHEQSRNDRDDYVRINIGNIQEGRENNFQKRGAMRPESAGTYDYGSVMHYGRTAFSNNGRDTIVPLNPAARIGQRRGMSEQDKTELRDVYGC